MKAIFTEYIFKNKLNFFGFPFLIFLMAFQITDYAFLYFIAWFLPDTYNLLHEEFSFTLPVSLKDRVKAHLIYILLSISILLIVFLGVSLVKPYPIQKMVIGISAIIASTFFRTRKFFNVRPFIQFVSVILQFIIVFMLIEKNNYPLVSFVVSVIFSLLIYSIKAINTLKKDKEYFYVKS